METTRSGCASTKRTADRGWPRQSDFALAYNLGNFLCRLGLPKSVRQWSLTTLKEKLVKIGAKVTRHAKDVTCQLAEVAVPRQRFASILERIGRLKNSPALCPSGSPRSLRRDGGAEYWRRRRSGSATTAKKGRNPILKTDRTPRPIAPAPPVDGMAAG